MNRLRVLIGVFPFLACLASPAWADFSFTSTGSATGFDFQCFTSKHCFAGVPITSAGVELFTLSNPGQVTGVNGTFPATQSGTWNINNISGTVSLPTGAATGANQSTEITALGTINTTLGTPMQNSGGSVTANLGTIGGAATSANQSTALGYLSTIATNSGAAIPTQGNTVSIGGVGILPGASSSLANTPVSSSALAANQVVKAGAGNLYSFQVAADSTLSGAAWWIMLYNATSAPTDGSVTPLKCYAMPSGTTTASFGWPTPVYFSTGITIGVSTTGCFTKTASTHAFISGDAQ